jgi:hypothetical protein
MAFYGIVIAIMRPRSSVGMHSWTLQRPVITILIRLLLVYAMLEHRSMGSSLSIVL